MESTVKSTKVTADQKPKADYKLSRVTDGLWTVEGTYPDMEDPAEYFEPSPLYMKAISRRKDE